MDRTIEYRIPEAFAGARLDAFLRAQGYSGTVLKLLRKDSALVLLDSVPSRLVDPVRAGMRLRITIPEEPTGSEVLPEKIPLDVVYEDEDILLVSKSADMAIYPTPANPGGTLANACRARYGADFTLRCLGRLDRHTSGLVLIAKNRLSACILTDALHSDGLRRTYIAAVRGLCPAHGTIDAPIARDPDSILLRRVDPDGVRAVTHYERLYCANGYSLARIVLETGRTHQIRVHMKHIGHPLPGDFLYDPSPAPIPRPALHAWQLDFVHPVTREKLHFVSPVPRDILAIFDENNSVSPF